MKQITRFCAAAWLLAVLLVPVGGYAASAGVLIKVTVIEAPRCIINNNNPIEVEFGDVMTTWVDGVSYKKTSVNYTAECASLRKNALELQVVGNTAAFDDALLQTDKKGLGIKLLQTSGVLPVNTPIKFTWPNKPALWAVPVQKAGVVLDAGEFNAAATMRLDYQ